MLIAKDIIVSKKAGKHQGMCCLHQDKRACALIRSRSGARRMATEVQSGAHAILPDLPMGQHTTDAQILKTGKENSQETCLYVLLLCNMCL